MRTTGPPRKIKVDSTDRASSIDKDSEHVKPLIYHYLCVLALRKPVNPVHPVLLAICKMGQAGATSSKCTAVMLSDRQWRKTRDEMSSERQFAADDQLWGVRSSWRQGLVQVVVGRDARMEGQVLALSPKLPWTPYVILCHLMSTYFRDPRW